MDPSKWSQEISHWGIHRLIYAVLMRRLKPVLTLCRIHLRAHISDRDPIAQPGVEFRLASTEKVLRAAADPAMGLDAAKVSAPLARGDPCSAAFVENQMVAYTWRAFTGTPHTDDIWVHVQRPCRYGYRAFTRPEYRARHLQDPIALLTDQLCLERGYTHALSFVETHNFPSIASDMPRANVLIGWAGYLKRPGGYLTFRTPGVRKHHFRFYEPSRDPAADRRSCLRFCTLSW